MYKKCLICEQDSKVLVLNNLKMKKCRNCGLIWRQNFDISDSHYEENKVDLSQEKIRMRILNSKDRINILKKYADLNNLCDVGCGDGSFLKTLRQKGYKNVIGIEPNSQFLDFVQKNNLKVYKGTIENSSELIKNENIHTVTMFHLIEHLENPKKSLKLIYDNIKKGDKLIIETPNIDGYSMKKMNYKHKLIYSEHLFYFNISNLNKLLKTVGFKIIAYGKTDFLQYDLSIRESLFRLGLLSFSGNFFDGSLKQIKKSGLKLIQKDRNNFIKLFLKNIIRKILSKIVVLSNRLDYIWVIAEKN